MHCRQLPATQIYGDDVRWNSKWRCIQGHHFLSNVQVAGDASRPNIIRVMIWYGRSKCILIRICCLDDNCKKTAFSLCRQLMQRRRYVERVCTPCGCTDRLLLSLKTPKVNKRGQVGEKKEKKKKKDGDFRMSAVVLANTRRLCEE